MYRNIIDTHAHMDDAFFLPRIDEVAEQEKSRGVAAVITSGSEIPSSIRSVELAKKYDLFYASVGIYPNETAHVPEDYLETLRELASFEKTVAIGEIGLDYAFDPNHNKEQQEHYFREQLKLAEELKLPVVIHNREADEDTLRILKEYRPKGVIHRIFSHPDYGRAFMDLGIHMGIGPQITYENGGWLRELVHDMPLELLVLETDAPFLPPAALEGEMATPSMISYVAEAIAKARGDMTPQEVLDVAADNSRRLFGLL